MTPIPALARLLAPVDPDRFFAEHWERAPLVVTGRSPDHYADLLTLADLDQLLAEGGLQYPGLRLVRDGKPLPRTSFTADVRWGDGAFREAIVAERVLAEYRAGATVVFQALHRRHGPLARLCRELERHLACRFQTNVYLTPAGERGLGVHVDRHDVLVLQVDGSKDWTVWEAPAEPGAIDPGTIAASEPIHRLTLRPGDLLYLPRGYPHQAAARDEPSAHVALGVVATSWADVFETAVADLRTDPHFRRSLPIGALTDPAAWAGLENDFAELCRRFADTAALAPLLDRLAARFADTRPPLVDGRLAAATRPEETPEPTLDSRLVRAPRLVAHLVQTRATDDAPAELVFHGKRVVFPAAAHAALERMQAGEPFTVGELPGRLDDTSRLVVARRLLAEGYLVATTG